MLSLRDRCLLLFLIATEILSLRDIISGCLIANDILSLWDKASGLLDVATDMLSLRDKTSGLLALLPIYCPYGTLFRVV
jgi:hypothetical protein